jgi:DNA helicase-2/ATP-dependent DNA helicase PcrA
MIALTEEQQFIVGLREGDHLVLAPPGTGKTELLAERLSNAAKSGVRQEDMICLTFTNRAAANMVERTGKKIGSHKIFIGNLHSWCSEYLRKNRIIPQNVSLLDEEDSLLIIDELKDELINELKDELKDKIYKGKTSDGIKDRGELIKLNSFIKQKKLGFSNEVLLPPKLSINAEIVYKELLELCEKYEKIKKSSLYLDLDDLLTLSYHHLLKNPTSTSISWIQIDEVQDLNPLQWGIVNAITSKKNPHRVFFGDYEQAIFSFMGAKLDSLNEFRKNGAQIHFLYDNFRSPQYLLDLYNEFANSWLSPDWLKAPVSNNKLKKQSNSLALRIITGDPHSEANWIVSKKLPHEPTSTTAILVRSNRAADLYAEALNNNNLKYFKVSGVDLFRRKEIKDLLAFFNVLIKGEDRKSWARVLWLYAKTRTLRESRKISNEMWESGIRPLEFSDSYPYDKPLLDEFLINLKVGRIVVFDTETTGLDTENDDIIQIAAIEIVNGEIGNEFEVFINTDKDLTDSEKIHHISKTQLNNYSIEKKSALKQFLNFVNDDVLVAHNANYDMSILRSNLKREGLPQTISSGCLFDSIELAHRLYPDFQSYKLEFLIKALGVDGENTHNALDDVKATVNLLLSFESKIKETEELRVNFKNNHKKYLVNFEQRFSPIYNAIAGEFSNDMPLEEIVSMVMSFMDNHLGCKIKKEVYEEVSKLTRHMKKTCHLDNALNTLKRYVPEYTKYTEVDLVLGDEKIFIATIHKAKGLEFENVIIPQASDNVFPHYFSKTKDQKDEDARLLYVAMTRARTNLYITCSTIIFSPKSVASFPLKLTRFIDTPKIKSMFNFNTDI